LIKLYTKEEERYVKKILNVDYEVNDICKACVLFHCAEKGLGFKIKCTPLKKQYPDIDQELFAKMSAKDKFWFMALEDVNFFSEHLCGFKLRLAQQEALMCDAPNKVMRLSRQSGKTISIGVKALHYAFKNPKKRVLFVTPYENQIRNVFDKINEMVSFNYLKDHFILNRSGKYYSQNPFEFRLKNGSRISAFMVNQSGGDGVRGQSADFIIFDEVDYIAKSAIDAVLAIKTANPNIEQLSASTPTGFRGYFWNWCHSEMVKEIHYSYQQMEHYSKERDEEYKREMDTDTYKREILAEFTFQESGVFGNQFIDKCLEDYEFDNLTPRYNHEGCVYTIGADWNEGVAGVHIVVNRFDASTQKMTVSNVIIIPPSEFTQLVAVNKLIELNEVYNPVKIVVDEGFGNTQIQMLKKYAQEHPESNMEGRLHPVQYNGMVEINDPFNPMQKKLQSIKPLIVSITTRYLENSMFVLPKSEDYPQKLIGQMRNYCVESISEGNLPKYTKGYVHTLEAFMNAVYGMWIVSPTSFLKSAQTFSDAKPIMLKPQGPRMFKPFSKTKSGSFERSRVFI